MVKDKMSSFLLSVAVFFFIITFSISLPIYFRPFYYLHINALDLAEDSGYSYAEIKESYDQVLDYLTLPNREFGVGVMRYSQSGASHFADCKMLFMLNSFILILSGFFILTLRLLKRMGKIREYKFSDRSPSFWAATLACSLTVLLTAAASLSFHNAFNVFHKIFFIGKDNWYFDPRYDEIINILPEKFFMNCALFIVFSIITLSLAIIIGECILIKKTKKRILKNFLKTF